MADVAPEPEPRRGPAESLSDDVATSDHDRAARATLNSAALARWLSPTSETRVEQIAPHRIRLPRWATGTPGDAEPTPALQASIAVRGVVSPVLLRRLRDGTIEVVCGIRRVRAAQTLGLASVPAVVREIDDSAAVVLAAWDLFPALHLDQQQRQALVLHLSALGIDETEANVLCGRDPEAATEAGAESETAGYDAATPNTAMLRGIQLDAGFCDLLHLCALPTTTPPHSA